MEKINAEIIISSLFISGFDKVDTLLYIYSLVMYTNILCEKSTEKSIESVLLL